MGSGGAPGVRMVKCRIMASRSVNKVILIGHLGRDAETAYTASQTAVTKFSVATNRRWKDQATGDWKEETDWSNVVLWRQENLANYLTKGKQVYVEGRLQTRSYDDKDGKKQYRTEVVADDVILLGGRGGDGGGAGGRGHGVLRCKAARSTSPEDTCSAPFRKAGCAAIVATLPSLVRCGGLAPGQSRRRKSFIRGLYLVAGQC